MRQNLQIMDKIINKYKPKSDSIDVMDFKEKSEDGLLSVGLEQVAKHLTKLSKGKLNL